MAHQNRKRLTTPAAATVAFRGAAVSARVAASVMSLKPSAGMSGERHGVCRDLIRVWVETYEAGTFTEEHQAAGLMQA